MREQMVVWRRIASLVVSLAAVAVFVPLRGQTQAPASPAPAPSGIQESDVRRWLTDLSSDAMQGRRTFTEGYGLASAYVANELQKIGAKPLGDNGTYLQEVAQKRYRVTRNSSVTVEVGGEKRTFRHGEHVTFPDLAGAPQDLTFSTVEFAGYGRTGIAPTGAAGSATAGNDFTGRDVRSRLVVWMPQTTGTGAGAGRGGRQTSATRSAFMVQSLGAGAVVSLGTIQAAAPAQPAQSSGPGGGRGGGGRGTAGGGDGPPQIPEITTVERVDRPRPPVVVGDETFFEFLFSKSPTSFADLRSKAQRNEAVAPFTLDGATVTFQVNDTYEVTSTELTHNVVGLVEGSDPNLRETYVFFGAHLDHVGYASGTQARGRVNTPLDEDRIWNGADDDGSGSSALLAMAKAFATGQRPRRSVVFVWHAGEELNLVGSRYMAESPVVPLDRVQAQFNVDMIGRNRDDDPAQENTVFVIGADRISTDLHNLIVRANGAAGQPMKLDFEYNDPADPNSFYTRSDHYSYASKDIPIAFFFTGTHSDYHANTDTVDKILFPKLLRVTELIYRAGRAIADDPRPIVRDRRGARAGNGFQGLLEP